ncbi:MAG: hypothetical protein GY941_19085 [Planctomycetes bacterium]|nr:hypothetical protein [Planctomycetota bacterium]
MNSLKFIFFTKNGILNIKSYSNVVTYFMCLLVLLYSLGCASIISKSIYPVNINSDPDGAEITITDEVGKIVYTGVTPTTVTLNTKRGYFKGKDYTVAFKKPGYDSHLTTISRKADGWYLFGNLIFGVYGLVGWLVVDPISGAMWKFEQEVSTTLISKTSSLNTKMQSIKIVRLKDVPGDLRGKMVPIN